MKVKKMKELLSRYNPEAKVKFHGHDGDAVVTVYQNPQDRNIAVLQGYEDDSLLKNSGAMNLTVRYMLELLDRINPDAEVKLHLDDGESLLFVVTYVSDDSVVWLEAESDNDMYSEIAARFEDALENGVDELDVYMDMLEIGIDVDMVRRWMDDEAADHMEQFCKEHGLL